MSDVAKRPEAVAQKAGTDFMVALWATSFDCLERLVTANARFAESSLLASHDARTLVGAATQAHASHRQLANHALQTIDGIQSYWSDVRDLMWGAHAKFIAAGEALLAQHQFDALDFIDRLRETTAAGGQITMTAWGALLRPANTSTATEHEIPNGAAKPVPHRKAGHAKLETPADDPRA
ncbi:hypothetical protein LIG30_2447 [Burkholderia sp. lig30]|uniref:hypothetical protein n=1 Tax=Burkholderia sp. lig30 TaxID=1192124 RepID=UPI000461A028|nr:hypothetical protein [Burkholderia sp. lig30]KDB08396.1 hypothetical protein LIG30_2447 [Burkholderia sp. lig30]